MQPILVIAAVAQEISLLIRSMQGKRLELPPIPEIHSGKIHGRELLVAATGIGKVNSASSLAAIILSYRPRLVISTGCAGAYPQSGLRVGDLALASSDLFGDEGVTTPEGWRSLEHIGIPSLELKGNRYFNEIPLSFTLATQAVQLASKLELTLRRGRFVTVSTCSGTAARGEELYSRYGGLCENMEGAAAAQVALQYGIDCLEVRGISNMVEDRDLSRWDIPLAAEQAQRFILRYIEAYC